MRSKKIPAEEQYRLIMECRQRGLTDHQWCVEHDIKPGTFYNWVKRLRQKGCMDLPASTGRSHSAPESQEVVRVDFHDTDTLSYEQPLIIRSHPVSLLATDTVIFRIQSDQCT